MTAAQIRPFMGQIFTLCKTYGSNDRDEWTRTMAMMVLTLNPTEYLLAQLIVRIAQTDTSELPQFMAIKEIWDSMPGPALAAVLAADVKPQMVRRQTSDGEWYDAPTCLPCSGTGLMIRWTAWRAPGLARNPLPDSFADQLDWQESGRFHVGWTNLRRQAEELQLRLRGTNGTLLEVAEWCQCSYGQHRKKIDTIAKTASADKRGARNKTSQ